MISSFFPFFSRSRSPRGDRGGGRPYGGGGGYGGCGGYGGSGGHGGGGGGGFMGGGGGRGGYVRGYADGRDRADPCPCLGVFGMSLHTSERDLKHLFGRYGEVESVQVVYDRFTGRSRGFGFVYFTSTKDASRAKEHMTDAVIDGMKVRVDYSVTKGGGPYRHMRKSSKSPVRYRDSRSRSPR